MAGETIIVRQGLRGIKGDKGDPGPAGRDGTGVVPSAGQVVAGGASGSTVDLASGQYPKGDGSAVVAGDFATDVAATPVLAPGSPGDLKGTAPDGVSITNIRPGRIDARVRGMSPSNSNDSTLLKSLLQEAATAGAELWLPDGTYKAAIAIDRTVGGAKLAGRGTIQAPATTAPFTLNGDVNGNNDVRGFTIEGITLDGAGVVACVVTTGGGPYSDVTFRGVRFRNTAASGGSGLTNAIADSTGASGLLITGCTFEATLGGGINIMAPHNLQVIANRFDGQTGTGSDAIAVTASASKSFTGANQGIVITGNIGFGIGRMGVEIFSTGGVALATGVIVTDNWFDVTAGNNYGMSIQGADGAQVIGNTVIGTGSYGLEIASGAQVVAANRCIGFATGIILNTAPRTVVHGNFIKTANIGINVTTNGAAGASCEWPEITANRIIDPRDTGIALGVASGGLSGGAVVTDNLIYRSRVDADDSTRTFVGIQTNVPTGAPHKIERNTVIQAAASPTLSGFRGFSPSGTNTVRSRFCHNTVKSLSTAAFGIGIVPGSGAVSIQGMVIEDNHFENLTSPLQGGNSTMTAAMARNTITSSPGTDSRGMFAALAIPPATASALAASSPTHLAIRGHNNAAPVVSDGVWSVGDIVMNNAPAETGTAGSKYVVLGWVCTVAGNPGTWLPLRCLTGN